MIKTRLALIQMKMSSERKKNISRKTFYYLIFIIKMQFTISSPSSKNKDVIYLQVNCFTYIFIGKMTYRI